MSSEAIHLLNLPKKHKLTQKHLEDVEISSPQNDQVLTYENATSKWKNKTPSAGGITYQYAEGTTDISTTSSTFSDMNAMSLTIASAGTYLIIFSSTAKVYGSMVAYGYFKMLKDSTVIGKSTLRITSSLGVVFNLHGSAEIMVVKSLAANDVVKVQWALGGGTRLECNPTTEYHHRSLTLIKLS